VQSEITPPESTQPAMLPPEVIPPVTEVPAAEVKPWGFWPTIGLGAAIFAIYFVAQSLVAIIFSVPYILEKLAANPELDPRTLVSELSTNGLMTSIAIIISAIAGIAFILLFVKIRKGISLRNYMALHPLKIKTVLVIIVVLAAMLVLSSSLDRFTGVSDNTNFMVNMYKTSYWPPLLWIATVIFAPLFEEGFFRGFLFAGLSRSFLGPAGTIFLTAAVFASLHALQYDAVGVATVFVLGLFFGIVRYKSGSLWSTIMLHSIWNLAGMIATALYIQGIG
jgi:uncharacterized protein